MNRCASSLAALALACTGVLATLVPATADAQVVQRKFPQNALRGKISFGQSPAIHLNGTATVMAASYRVHSTNNLIVMAAGLANGLTYTVDYTLDMQDRVQEVWILTATEVAKQPWPTTKAQAQAWTFDPVAQTWTK
jgi:hypothetical protein